MEALYEVNESQLDLVLHSPGGSPEAAEAIVQYLRQKFDHIRLFVPHMAMSAATMIACAADEIVMGKHSYIGPIDPQLQLQTSLGARSVPAQTIIDQFEVATRDMMDPSKARAWVGMLSQYGPDLLITCERATQLSQELVSKWLKAYMFVSDVDRDETSRTIAAWLSDNKHFKTHGRPISRDEARSRGLKISNLEENSELQDAILSIHHATAHTFANSGACKIVENHKGKAFIENVALPAVNPAQLLFKGFNAFVPPPEG